MHPKLGIISLVPPIIKGLASSFLTVLREGAQMYKNTLVTIFLLDIKLIKNIQAILAFTAFVGT